MGLIKRNITDITDLLRGNVDVNFVYRGNVLVWQRVTPGVPVLNSFRNGYYQALFAPPVDTDFENSYYYNKLNNV